MNKSTRRISTAGMDRSEWLELRRKSIGGSDAAAIVFLNPFSSPFSVWAEKTGRMPEKPESEAMRQGRDLEDYVATRWTEKTGKKVKRENAILYNDAYPFACANIDRRIVGENAGLECKTTSVMNLKRFKGGDYPASYYVQCVHYMAVTGADRWYLGVLVLNQGFYEFTIERDEGEIAALMEQEREFWKLVESDTPPAPDGLDATSGAIGTIYAESDGGMVDLFGRDALLGEYEATRNQMALLNTDLKRMAQTLKLDMQEAETGACGLYAVKWKKAVRSYVSIPLLRQVYPKLDLSKVMKASVSRRFSVTKKEEMD